MRVVFLETAPPQSIGSMTRYANLLQMALAGTPGVECSRAQLAISSLQLTRVPRRFRTLAHHAAVAWRANSIVRHNPADLYHVVDGSHGYITRWLPPGKTIVTAHDVIPELQSRGRFSLQPPGSGARWLIRASLNGLLNATHVISVSQSTANDLVAMTPIPAERISVVPLTLPPEFLPQPGHEGLTWNLRRTCHDPFMLHIGNNAFYKNRIGVLRIFDRIRSNHRVRLKLAGPPPDAEICNLIQERGLDSLVDFICNPSDTEIIELYRTARLLLFPSVYEGFGWPPLEAMAWGCPVVCSSNGSLPEVVGDAALIADASDEAQLASYCVSVLEDQTLSATLVLRGLRRTTDFSLERFRSHLLSIYHTVISHQRS